MPAPRVGRNPTGSSSDPGADVELEDVGVVGAGVEPLDVDLVAPGGVVGGALDFHAHPGTLRHEAVDLTPEERASSPGQAARTMIRTSSRMMMIVVAFSVIRSWAASPSAESTI